MQIGRPCGRGREWAGRTERRRGSPARRGRGPRGGALQVATWLGVLPGPCPSLVPPSPLPAVTVRRTLSLANPAMPGELAFC